MPAARGALWLAANLLPARARPRNVATLGFVLLLVTAATLWRGPRPKEEEDAAPLVRIAQRSAEVAAAAQLSHGAKRRAAPARHVYFLKTHKCASTTVQRIILTYAIQSNLSVALPTTKMNSFYPSAFSTAQAKRTCNYPRFDVMAAHALFSESARRAMPADTVYVAIVRDPAEQMESAYYYYLVGYCRIFTSKSLSFGQYLSTAIRLYGGGAGASSHPLLPLRYGCNMRQMRFLQLHDFGFDLSRPLTRQRVQAAIERFDALFDIVLVVERLDEGLVLLRDLLGWSTTDMLYLRSNFRVSPAAPKAPATAKPASTPSSPTQSMSNATRHAAYAWNWGDKMLYDHFRAKMDTAIAQNAAYLSEQVRDFRRRQAEFHESCVANVTRRSSMRSGSSIRTGLYVLNDGRHASTACRLAAMSELDLFRLMNKQQPKCIKRGPIAPQA